MKTPRERQTAPNSVTQPEASVKRIAGVLHLMGRQPENSGSFIFSRLAPAMAAMAFSTLSLHVGNVGFSDGGNAKQIFVNMVFAVSQDSSKGLRHEG